MPSQSLLPRVKSPDGPTQDNLFKNMSSIPDPGTSMTPHATSESEPAGCMFCDRTFTHPDELGPHVLTEHPTTFFEPAVLRVDAEFRFPGERPPSKPISPTVEKEEVLSCIICGQVTQDAGELETHMRKHKDYFTYCCKICGRRFREPWFLKNHMKKHGKTKSMSQKDSEPPATINGVVLEPSEPVVTLYKMCMVCGFFFPDHDTLVEHSKVHNREAEPSRDGGEENLDSDTQSGDAQETFLQGMGLLSRSTGSSSQPKRSSKWIPQLDPITTYQAWQVATKGKVAVSNNTTKDVSQEGSTDCEGSGSDKDELNNNPSESQKDKNPKEALGRELRSQAVVEPQQSSLMEKEKEKDRPTTCEECQRTFRTYHQLVLHSRIHKRERGGEETPTIAEGKLSRVSSLEPPEEGPEEGLEESSSTESLAIGEEGSYRSKSRSKECSYCHKSFRSSYYLTVHLRTHTGEKPFKCVYCDYAAAQKTSLKYHMDRRHKDRPAVEIPSRPVPPVIPVSDGNVEKDQPNPAPNTSKVSVPNVEGSCTSPKSEVSFNGIENKPGNPVVQVKTENEELVFECVSFELGQGDPEGPLNLSLNMSVVLSSGPEPANASVTIPCPFCPFETMYPEVLVIHTKINHEDKLEPPQKNVFQGNLKLKRSTGCPPTLDGKDVPPLEMIGRRHPRRTKSPPRLPAKPEVTTPVIPPPSFQPPPFCLPIGGDVWEPQCQRPNINTRPSQEPPKHSELVRKPNPGSNVVERPGPPERNGIGERSYPTRSSVMWQPDAARLCLSSQFASLPQMDFGEPLSKRLKYNAPIVREADGGEKPVLRGPVVNGNGRMPMSGKGVKTPSQGSAPSDNLGCLGGLDNDWGMMNFLHPYSPNDLASLYHAPPPPPGHGGLVNPKSGGRMVLYQPIHALPTLQMRAPPALFSNQRYGSTDKST
ncbi:zinc finger protein 217 [Antennarius striatus]|uniref:zinc finger protein 217 n=1 Tax=Antennarius striatus TaxID=241820 RepID=UPI0035B1FB03